MKACVGALVLLFFSFSCPHLGCNTTEPPPASTVQLSVEDAGVTEAWLKVSLTDNNEPRTVALKRDGQTVQTLRISSLDSIVVDTALLPHRSYSYKAYRVTDSRFIDSSTQLTLTTMDTTSHDWVFDPPVLLGDGSSSVLYDVAIINDTLAYAVGEIYKRDSLGNWDPNAYNLAKWNGGNWELMRIQFYTFCGQSGMGSYPAKAIFAFSAQDIWVAMDGSQVVRWNGQTQSQPMCTPVSINKLWGDSPNSMYAVGYGGGIAHYSSGTWQRVESGTTLPIWDVFGVRNEAAGEYEIISVASNHSFPEGRKLLKIQGTTVNALPDSGLSWSIDEIWFVPRRKYVVVGDGLYEIRALGEVWARNMTLPPLYKESIDGQGLNDIVVVGSFWNFLHFNGSTWRSYFPFSSGSLGSVAIKGDFVIAVGVIENKALVVQGRR